MAHLITPEIIAAVRSSQFKRVTRVIDELITVKVGPDITKRHYDLLAAVHSTGAIACPKPLFFVEMDDCNALVMSTIPGKRLYNVMRKMDNKELKSILAEVKIGMDSLQEPMRTLLSPETGQVGSIPHGGSLLFPLLSGFHDSHVHIDQFVETMSTLTRQLPQFIESQRSVLSELAVGPLVFCHMDLGAANIMVHDGRLSGVVDWDTAGWYTSRMDCYSVAFTNDINTFHVRALLEVWRLDDAGLMELVRITRRGLAPGNMRQVQEDRKLQPKRRKKRGTVQNELAAELSDKCGKLLPAE